MIKTESMFAMLGGLQEGRAKTQKISKRVYKATNSLIKFSNISNSKQIVFLSKFTMIK